jgi:glycine/D-amino acid oxidase-like deaminating enzyme
MRAEGGEAIVGGGVMGLSLARALAQRGREVTLYSAGERGAEGASALPVALLNPFRGRTGRASAEDRSALATV